MYIMCVDCVEKMISFTKFNPDFTRVLWRGHYLKFQQVVSGLWTLFGELQTSDHNFFF